MPPQAVKKAKAHHAVCAGGHTYSVHAARKKSTFSILEKCCFDAVTFLSGIISEKRSRTCSAASCTLLCEQQARSAPWLHDHRRRMTAFLHENNIKIPGFCRKTMRAPPKYRAAAAQHPPMLRRVLRRVLRDFSFMRLFLH